MLALAFALGLALAQAPQAPDVRAKPITLRPASELPRLTVDRIRAALETRRLNQATLDRMVARECEERVRRALEDCPCR